MRIAACSPYGFAQQETGLILLLANYLKRIYPEVVQLRCNGVLSLCDRDSDSSWRRDMNTCFQCQGEQRELARWSNLTLEDLSRHLEPGEIESTKRWIVSLRAEALMTAAWEGVPVFPLAAGTWQNRFETSRPDPANRSHEQMMRRFMLSAVRLLIAGKRFHASFAPDAFLVASGEDLLSRSLIAAAEGVARPVTLFRWDVSRRAVLIRHPGTGAIHPCELLLDNLTSLRADPATWSEALLGIVDEILAFLGIVEPRAQLALAR